MFEFTFHQQIISLTVTKFGDSMIKLQSNICFFLKKGDPIISKIKKGYIITGKFYGISGGGSLKVLDTVVITEVSIPLFPDKDVPDEVAWEIATTVQNYNIDDVTMSTRLRNGLKEIGLFSINEIAAMPSISAIEEAIRKKRARGYGINSLGRKSISELINVLEKYNIYLRRR